MKISAFGRERLACAYFFAIPGLVYGIFTARLPALKNMAQADDGMIGFLLLAFGSASFAGLLASKRVMAAFGQKAILGATTLILPAAMSIAGLVWNYWQLMAFCLIGGLATGICEVALNAQGMMIEQRYQKLCMASLHACFSLGGLAGSLSGSLFAKMEWTPAVNFVAISAIYLLFWPLALRYVTSVERADKKAASVQNRTPLPHFIIFCGLISMLCYVSEGTVGEWGSILLHSEKGAPQDEAALVFGCFCTTMVIFRFFGDRLREALGDVRIVLGGALLGAISMAAVLLAPDPLFCLSAYAVMGAGFAPIVPVLFSRAGKCRGIALDRASAAVSIMSYTGLLFFPPFLGMLGDAIGLGSALWIIVGACLCIAIGGALLLRADPG